MKFLDLPDDEPLKKSASTEGIGSGSGLMNLANSLADPIGSGSGIFEDVGSGSGIYDAEGIGIGSGSGLIDLTRKSCDDTALAMEILDEISPPVIVRTPEPVVKKSSGKLFVFVIGIILGFVLGFCLGKFL